MPEILRILKKYRLLILGGLGIVIFLAILDPVMEFILKISAHSNRPLSIMSRNGSVLQIANVNMLFHFRRRHFHIVPPLPIVPAWFYFGNLHQF
jgi:hypothetical protein